MPSALIDLCFSGAGFLGHILLLYVLIRRKHLGKFPCFSLLVGANLARTIVLSPVHRYGSLATYFYTYWIWAFFDITIQLFCTAELAVKVFRPRAHWIEGLKSAIRWWVFASFLLSSLLTVLAKPDVKLTIQRVVMRFDMFTSVLVCTLVVGLIVLSSQRGLPLRSYVATIAVGLGVYALLGVVIDSARTYFGVRKGTEVYIDLSYLRMSIYLLCLGYWIAGLWRKPMRPRARTDDIQHHLLSISQDAESSLQSMRIRRRG